mmetsp:Transcript_2004/g.7248  ORF Transcript_2004/g.7248 Transcript_2004/m.7248 type:complete len:259 (-) Transcript_2004:73-849(-)|eukprot:CAMPEP_0114618196 /NCGR_PEP_ID=MMETSP0168-20121206/7581_1 /TAXON_ID=95228 ORGANISM="Vannella sp., Strain DIVA3 517/6/12" /NCGR_SAMPLE_ID=MMETSP0168 /ASSEMBLY_ACC=CAM_ASM_000044 /LENGTH=258 /DNA_ID=CAMNT_0001829341 /DNA_START=26 /DNA_END=802 /DNA_ORIENTATION=+
MASSQFAERFAKLASDPIEMQQELFLKSFIFALGDDWKEVGRLATQFTDYLRNTGDEHDLNPAAAAEFLQKNGKTRTALQRRDEIRDIDLDQNDRIAFVEYLMLHYKAMILTEYYKRHQTTPEEDLSNDGIGVINVGHKLLEELFTMPAGLSPELEAAIEEFYAQKRARQQKMDGLREKAAAGGVRGMTAKNELAQMEAGDVTEMNRMELTLEAAKRRSMKTSGEEALRAKQHAEESERANKLAAGRNKIKGIASMWE